MTGTVICHHGIKGQKWGVRRFENPDGTLTPEGKKRYAENYSTEQRQRDKQVYSKGAVKRINKKMLEGQQLQTARSAEADRIEKFRKTANLGGKIADAVGGIAGGIGGAIGGRALMKKYSLGTDNDLAQFAGTAAFGAAGSTLGRTIARYSTRTLTMAIGGYGSEKYR